LDLFSDKKTTRQHSLANKKTTLQDVTIRDMWYFKNIYVLYFLKLLSLQVRLFITQNSKIVCLVTSLFDKHIITNTVLVR